MRKIKRPDKIKIALIINTRELVNRSSNLIEVDNNNIIIPSGE
jgi:hypothetical protein